MKNKSIFGIRKYKLGVASVLLGTFATVGVIGTASADEVSSENDGSPRIIEFESPVNKNGGQQKQQFPRLMTSGQQEKVEFKKPETSTDVGQQRQTISVPPAIGQQNQMITGPTLVGQWRTNTMPMSGNPMLRLSQEEIE